MVHAGKLREWVTVSIPGTTTTNAFGGQVAASPERTMQLPAQVVVKPARELVLDNQLAYSQPYTVTIRYNEAVQPNAALAWRDKTLQVVSVSHDERFTLTTLLCIGNS